MTQKKKTPSHLTYEEDFPDNLDWRMYVEIREKERDQRTQLNIKDLGWEYALDQSLRFIGLSRPIRSSIPPRDPAGNPVLFRFGPTIRIWRMPVLGRIWTFRPRL